MRKIVAGLAAVLCAGAVTTACDMYANRYPMEDALKLFGAIKGKGAQDVK